MSSLKLFSIFIFEFWGVPSARLLQGRYILPDLTVDFGQSSVMADVFDDVGVLVGLREIVEIFRYPLLFEEFVCRPIFYPVGKQDVA